MGITNNNLSTTTGFIGDNQFTATHKQSDRSSAGQTDTHLSNPGTHSASDPDPDSMDASGFYDASNSGFSNRNAFATPASPADSVAVNTVLAPAHNVMTAFNNKVPGTHDRIPAHNVMTALNNKVPGTHDRIPAHNVMTALNNKVPGTHDRIDKDCLDSVSLYSVPEIVELPPQEPATVLTKEETLKQDIIAGMVAKIDRLKDAQGHGTEHYGQGNPEVMRRRRLLAPLMQAGVLPKSLAEHKNIKEDMKFINSLEFTDIIRNGSKDFNRKLKRHVVKAGVQNANDAAQQLKELRNGDQLFYQVDPQTMSTTILKNVGSDSMRQQIMVDMLLQLRGAKNVAGDFERHFAGADGVQAVLEMRRNLASLPDNLSSLTEKQEYALLRLIATSLPVRNGNAMLEARHLIGSLRRDTWQLVYGDAAIPKGCSISPYAAIHQNYSSETSDIISAFVSQAMFSDQNPQLFVFFVEAMNASAAEDSSQSTVAEYYLNQIENIDPAVYEDFQSYQNSRAGESMANIIEDYLVSKSDGRLDSVSPATIKSFHEFYSELKLMNDFNPETVRNNYINFDDLSDEQKYNHIEEVAYEWLDEYWADAMIEACAKLKDSGESSALTYEKVSEIMHDVYGLNAYEVKHLSKGNLTSVTGNYREKLTTVASLYQAVVGRAPTVENLSRKFGVTGQASTAFFGLIWDLKEQKDPSQVMKSIVAARQALKEEFMRLVSPSDQYGQTFGYKRYSILLLDKKLEMLHNQYLGSQLSSLTSLESQDEQLTVLKALSSALEGVILSDVNTLRDSSDPYSGKTMPLDELHRRCQGLIDDVESTADGAIPLDRYHKLMEEAYSAINGSIEDARVLFDGRMASVSLGKLIPNPAFMDDFIKESPLHYALGLVQKGLQVGVTSETSQMKLLNPENVAVLNRIGRTVFDKVWIAERMSDLDHLDIGKNDFVLVKGDMDEKKMDARVKGIMAELPGGFSHIAVYSRNSGIVALSAQEKSPALVAFFEKLEKDKEKLYYDDRNGQLLMTSAKQALNDGLISEDQIPHMKTGSNRHVTYYQWSETAGTWKVSGEHTNIFDENRRMYDIDIYTATDIMKSLGNRCLSMEEASTLGINARGLAGEKGMVLSLLSADESLKPYTVPGSIIPPGVIKKLLAGAQTDEVDEAGKRLSLLDCYDKVWKKDPEVGEITDKNFLESEFYTNADYRESTRAMLEGLVRKYLFEYLTYDTHDLVVNGFYNIVEQKVLNGDSVDSREMAELKKHLDNHEIKREYQKIFIMDPIVGILSPQNFKSSAFVTDAEYRREITERVACKLQGKIPQMPSAAGKALLDELMANEQLAACHSQIYRSSFTAEDRPYKSGAGQYDSFPACKTACERLDGIIGVIASGWSRKSIENNVAEEFNLRHIFPTITVQKSLQAKYSGVAISRDTDTQQRRVVSYQATRGFGGGVEDGKTEEGRLYSDDRGSVVLNPFPGKNEGESLLTENQREELHQVILDIEKVFHLTVEKGKGFAVDVEWVIDQDDALKIVQARTIQV
jgi:hypothetical protein